AVMATKVALATDAAREPHQEARWCWSLAARALVLHWPIPGPGRCADEGRVPSGGVSSRALTACLRHEEGPPCDGQRDPRQWFSRKDTTHDGPGPVCPAGSPGCTEGRRGR